MAIEEYEDEIKRAAKLIDEAKYLIVTAGAGLGIDSGLPAFRTKDGLWRAYPMFAKLGISNLAEMSNPKWFEEDPELAWGFWSHRTTSYLETEPHAGFDALRDWKAQDNCFVFTSNVDGQFQKAGFHDDRVYACHGEVTRLQCTDPECALRNGPFRWPDQFQQRDPIVAFDDNTLRVKDLARDAPHCAACGALARPNIMMFNDVDFCDRHQRRKHDYLGDFISKTRPRETVVVEIGAGTVVPTVRQFSESLAKRGCACIRINPVDSWFSLRLEKDPDATLVSLPLGGLEALQGIHAAISALRGQEQP